MILDCLFNLARFPPQSFEMDPPPLIYLTSFFSTPPYPRVMHCFASSLTISPPSKRSIDESLALYGTPHKGAIICVGVKINSGNEKKIKSELMSNFILSQKRSLQGFGIDVIYRVWMVGRTGLLCGDISDLRL